MAEQESISIVEQVDCCLQGINGMRKVSSSQNEILQKVKDLSRSLKKFLQMTENHDLNSISHGIYREVVRVIVKNAGVAEVLYMLIDLKSLDEEQYP